MVPCNTGEGNIANDPLVGQAASALAAAKMDEQKTVATRLSRSQSEANKKQWLQQDGKSEGGQMELAVGREGGGMT